MKEILSRLDRRSVNYRMRSQSTKWKVLRGCAKLAVRCRLVKSVLANRLAHGAGLTALHYAAKRRCRNCDVAVGGGADPYIENEMGLTFRTSESLGLFGCRERIKGVQF